jgi:hypothetical protein
MPVSSAAVMGRKEKTGVAVTVKILKSCELEVPAGASMPKGDAELAV